MACIRCWRRRRARSSRNTPLTLAETASVFGEMLTFRSMLDKTTDKKQRFAMLSSKVEDMLNTVVRQIAFYTFERRVHTARKEGELTREQLDQIWLEVSVESLGPAVKLNDGYGIFWSYIPHFIHSPFYVYAYAFGDCLVNSLYAQYEKASDGFAERYFELLKAGGSKHHSELLKPFGLDARDPGFWSLGTFHDRTPDRRTRRNVTQLNFARGLNGRPLSRHRNDLRRHGLRPARRDLAACSATSSNGASSACVVLVLALYIFINP